MRNLAEIDQVLRRSSDAAEIPGVVATVGTSREVIYHVAFGKRDLSKDQPMTTNSVFWIASMTKAITAAAAMQLVEQDKLSLHEPVGKLLPHLANPQVLENFGADGEPKLRPAKTAITLLQLMTHTASFCYDMWNDSMATYLEKLAIRALAGNTAPTSIFSARRSRPQADKAWTPTCVTICSRRSK
ncbi:CubicO group peptidase (beta-lactamase class C family) [Bradyrhizobium sp. JR7.2]